MHFGHTVSSQMSHISHCPFLVYLLHNRLHIIHLASSVSSSSDSSLLLFLTSKWSDFLGFFFRALFLLADLASASSLNYSYTAGVVKTSTSFAWTHLHCFLALATAICVSAEGCVADIDNCLPKNFTGCFWSIFWCDTTVLKFNFGNAFLEVYCWLIKWPQTCSFKTTDQV